MAIDQKTIDAIIECRRSGATQPDIAHALGISPATVNKYCQRAAKAGRLGFKPVLDGFEVTQITSTPNGDFIQQKPEKGPEFELPEGHEISGVSALVAGDGRTIQQWVKTKASPAQQTKADLIEMLSEYRGKSEIDRFPPMTFDHELVTVYPTSDLHIGMLAWGRETGAKWDLAIARETVLGSMQELIAGAPRSKTAILLDMGDYTHNNSQTNETPMSRSPARRGWPVPQNRQGGDAPPRGSDPHGAGEARDRHLPRPAR